MTKSVVWQYKSCSKKRQKVNDNEYVDIATLIMPNLGDDDMGFQGFNWSSLHCTSYFSS